MRTRTRFWFFPVWSGDFRLEPHPEDESHCLLTVEDPTAADRKLLVPFIEQGRSAGWMDQLAGIAPKGKTELRLEIALAEAGPLLAPSIHKDHPQTDLWTAVRHQGGKLSVLDGVTLGDEEDKEEEPEAAVTVKKPKRGCPAPTPAVRRASEVLRAFSTRKQWAEFKARGRMTCIGSSSGRAYHAYHRDEAARRGMGHALVEASTGHEICVWDNSVAPEEELLSLKLAVEHREAWLRGLGRGAYQVQHGQRRLH